MLVGERTHRLRPRGGVRLGAILGVVVAAAAAALAGFALAASPYHDRAARTEAKRLLALIQLPAGAKPSAVEPNGATAALGHPPGEPVLPHLVDLHSFFIVPGSTNGVVDFVDSHRPAGSRPGDSGSDSGDGHYFRWTSFDFATIQGVLHLRELDLSAEQLRTGVVAVRVDSQVAPSPRLPGNGRGPGSVRVVDVGTMQGSFGFELSCDPAGGTVPHPARICAAIRADPALLYSFPGPDHSCIAQSPMVSIDGSWNHRRLRSTFSECTGGQEQQAAEWAALLPSPSAESTVRVDRGIGLVSLGESEQAVVDLLRGSKKLAAPCDRCTRTFSAGFSVGYGAGPAQPAGWTITFFHRQVTAIESNVPNLTVDGAYATRGFTSLRSKLRGWSVKTCPPTRELIQESGARTTIIVYGSSFERLLVTAGPPSCS